MSSVRHRSKAELPPTPLDFAYPLAVPDATVLGSAILDEVAGPFSLHVFQALRLVFAWAAGPDASSAVFDGTDLGAWEAAVLDAAEAGGGLWAPVGVIAGELARPAEADVEGLARACLAVTEWALDHGAEGTAILFAEAAAVVWPTSARIAWLAGKLHRARLQLSRAELWFRRAGRVAVWTGDWELRARAANSLGNLLVHKGDLAGGRELLLTAARVAKRKHLRERLATAQHDLLTACIYASRYDEAEIHAAQAFAAYGPQHPKVVDLAFDISHLWMRRGQFARALSVLKALHTRFTDPDRQLRTLASTARAAGAVGDTGTFQGAWDEAWKLIDDDVAKHLRAAAPLELGLGALNLGLWDHAEVALTTARDAARELREGETLARAEASIDHLARRQSVDRYSRPLTPAPGDLAARIVTSLNTQRLDALLPAPERE